MVKNAALYAPFPPSAATTASNPEDSYVKVGYSNWAIKATTNMSTGGTVVVTDRNGNTAVIAPKGTGYEVVMKMQGASTTFQIGA